MPTKKFDKKLYEDADPLSKGTLSSWLSKNGYTDINQEETYGVDIVCKKVGIPCYFETEIKYGWKGEWPNSWNEIRIPYRKLKIVQKWMREGSNGALTFVIFRSDCEQAWFIDGITVFQADVEKVSNKYVSNEKFFHIDVNDAHIINMGDIDAFNDIKDRKYPS
jgi:hypothetical protein